MAAVRVPVRAAHRHSFLAGCPGMSAENNAARIAATPKMGSVVGRNAQATEAQSAEALSTETQSTGTQRLGPPYSLSWPAMALIALYGLSLLIVQLGDQRTLTYHEVLFAQPAKEMLATGNWIMPQHTGVPSTHKPPGTHWILAATMWLTGSESEGVLRVPSVFAAIITALITAGLAARWFGRRVGVSAGLMLLTSYFVLQLARLAECDMLLTAVVCGAMACFAIANVDSPLGRVEARWPNWLFYLCAAASYLIKGFIGPLFIFSGCGLYALLQCDRRVWRFLLHGPGILLFLASSVGWMFAAYLVFPQIVGDQIWHHFNRFRGDLGGEQPPFFYAYAVLLIILPWTPLVVASILAGLRKGAWRDPFWRFAGCWFAPGMAVLILSACQSKHYAAPLMPPLVVAGAIGLLAYFEWRQRSGRLSHLLMAGLCVAACVGAIIAVRMAQPRGYETVTWLLIVLGAGLLLAIYCESQRRPRAVLAVVFSSVWIVEAAVLGLLMQRFDSYQDQTDLARRTNQRVPSGEPVFVVRLPESQICYYLHSHLQRYDDPLAFSNWLQENPGAVYALAPEFVVDELQSRHHVEVVDRCATVNRFLTQRDRITLVRVTPSEPLTSPNSAVARRVAPDSPPASNPESTTTPR
jgi:4-amino-4-deoxy-L-arabinose transferase-like glycosyltransferase